jgi:hypothetical protein
MSKQNGRMRRSLMNPYKSLHIILCISLSMSIVTNQMFNVTLSTLTSQPSMMDLLPIDNVVFGIQEGCKRFILQHLTLTTEPDYFDLPDNAYDWTYTFYGKVEELLPVDAPESLGNLLTLSHYVDANLMHKVARGRPVTGILHLVNKSPIEWYSKKQATRHTASIKDGKATFQAKGE